VNALRCNETQVQCETEGLEEMLDEHVAEAFPQILEDSHFCEETAPAAFQRATIAMRA